jgi:hypothetical protein
LTGTRPGWVSSMCGAAARRCEVLVKSLSRLRSWCARYRLLKGLLDVVQHLNLLGLGLKLVHLRVTLALEAIFKA